MVAKTQLGDARACLGPSISSASLGFSSEISLEEDASCLSLQLC